MKEESKAMPAPQAGPSAEREEAIRRMAYTLYEARGRVGGHELEDWLRAEALVAQASAARPGASAPPMAVAVTVDPAIAAAPAKAARKTRPAAKAAGTAAKKASPGAAKTAAAVPAKGAATAAGKTAPVATVPARKRAPPKPRTP